MGEVYLARDTVLGRSVAVKLLNGTQKIDDSAFRRFLQEAKAASALNHPNILVIHEIGDDEGLPYIVSEYIEGSTLRDLLCTERISVSRSLDIVCQIAGAFAAAHAAGIIHRDIKPENIILRPDGYVKILDFGLAKLTRTPVLGEDDETLNRMQTAPGLILGTVQYMSPEQARGQNVDERTDIFSLGVLLYELITRKTPFAGASMPDSLANLLNKEPPPIASSNPDIPGDLPRIVSKMLRKARDDRYQTMKGLLADLKELKARSVAEKPGGTSSTDSEKHTAIMQADTQAAAQRTHISRVFRPLPLLFASLLAIVLVVASLLVWKSWRPVAPPPNEIRSLAVLPLRSLDSSNDFLGLGVADAVIRKISQTGTLTVRPTSAVRRYLNEDTDALTAADQLSTDAVLEGSFQRSGDRLRVSVNLLRTGDGASLWTNSFDMTAADVFKIEDTVAQQVASQLKLRLDPAQQARMQRKYTSNPIAYEYYVKGIDSLDQRSYSPEALPRMLATIDLFKKAIDADPNYALAHAQLAYAYAWTAIMVDSTNAAWEPLANQEIDRSQELDPQLAESHIARALLLWSAYNGYQNEAAVREVLFAQKLNPTVGHEDLAAWFAHMGLEDASERERQLALEIDPTNQTIKDLSVIIYNLGGRYDEYLDAVKEIDPNAQPGAWYLLGKGRLDDADKAIGKYIAAASDARDAPAFRGLLYALRGDHRAAEAQVPAVLDSYPPNDQARHHAYYFAACIYALTGNSKESVKWLRQTAATGYPDYPLFGRDHYLDRIRQTPEFVQFMDEMRALNEKYRSEFEQQN